MLKDFLETLKTPSFRKSLTTLKFSSMTSKMRSFGRKKVYARGLKLPSSGENDTIPLSPSIQSLASPSVE